MVKLRPIQTFAILRSLFAFPKTAKSSTQISGGSHPSRILPIPMSLLGVLPQHPRRMMATEKNLIKTTITCNITSSSSALLSLCLLHFLYLTCAPALSQVFSQCHITARHSRLGALKCCGCTEEHRIFSASENGSSPKPSIASFRPLLASDQILHKCRHQLTAFEQLIYLPRFFVLMTYPNRCQQLWLFPRHTRCCSCPTRWA